MNAATIHHCAKYQTSRFNSSSVIALKPKVKSRFHMALMFKFYVLQNK